ncbi:MAG: DDE-type integrase/transposase/recombinase [Blastocatellia bacterium]
MKEQSLEAIQPKSYVPRTTDSRHGGRISPNLLKDNPLEVKQQGQVMVGDITYLALSNGKFWYLATYQDKYTRRIVGWAIEEMTAKLVVSALQMGLRRGLIGKNAIIIHTDRGSQCGGWLSRGVKRYELRQSMRRKRQLL